MKKTPKTDRLRAAERWLVAADANVQRANEARDEALASLRAAVLERDEALPVAWHITHRWRLGERQEVDRARVCVTRRTSRAVFTRRIGNINDAETQWRKDSAGQWCRYPSYVRHDGDRLEIEGEEKPA